MTKMEECRAAFEAAKAKLYDRALGPNEYMQAVRDSDAAWAALARAAKKPA